MKLLGLIGGMSWESTAIYYRHLNEIVRARFGGLQSAEILLRSFNFAPIAAEQASGDWSKLEMRMVTAARELEQCGADALMICSNTMHKLYEQTQAAVSVPVLHIADATCTAMQTRCCSRPLLLATRFTMEHGFYTDRLSYKFGIDSMVPDENGRNIVHHIIYDELCHGITAQRSKQALMREVNKALEHGADSVILGCTELCMLIEQSELDVSIFDTTLLHSEAAIARVAD
jgi:aspartate racemase